MQLTFTLTTRARTARILGSKHQRGASLIEVLVAIVIVSIGMLGLAGMYNYVLNTSKSANSRLAATLMAQDYAEMARANPKGFVSGHYNKTIGGSYDPADVTVPAAPTGLCDFPDCTPTTLAQRNTSEFSRRLRMHMPAGAYHAARVGTTNHLDIWIVWVEGKSSDAIDLPDTCPQSIIDRKSSLSPYPRCFYTRVAL